MADYAPSWRFDDENPEVSGRIITRKNVTTKYGDREVLEIETFDGRYDVWMTQAALRQWLTVDDPQPGDDVNIRYLGSEPMTNSDGTPWIPEGETEPGRRKLFSASRSPRIQRDNGPASTAGPASFRPTAPVVDDDIPF